MRSRGASKTACFRVERTEVAVPDGAPTLVAGLYRRRPEARITDIPLEVDDATRFTEAFTHRRTGGPGATASTWSACCSPRVINLDLRKMAEATRVTRPAAV